jgi:hypothetical protein
MGDIGRIGRDLGAAVSARVGRDVKVRLVTGALDNCVWMRIHAPDGPFAHATGDGYLMKGGRKGGCDDGTLRSLLDMPHDERIRHLTDDLAPRIEASLPFYVEAHDVQAVAMATTPLSDLAIGCTATYRKGAFYRVEWTGWDGDLSERRQERRIHADEADGKLAGLVQEIETRHGRLEAMRTAEPVMDMPLRRMLADHGRTAADLLEAARLHGLRPRKQDLCTASKFSYEGMSLALTIRDGRIQSEMGLAPGVVWKRGSVVAYDTMVPDTVRTALKGRRMRDVVDHPWLEGLVAVSASQAVGKGCATVTIASREG